MSSKHDVDYHISYPSLKDDGSNVIEDTQGSKQIRSIRDPRIPIIFLLGWLGASDRVLSKYSDFYSARGCITIRYTMVPLGMFFDRDRKAARLAQKILSLMEELGVTSNPVMFHLFSNNGATLYCFFSKELEKLDLDVRGCIFDSSPSPTTVRNVMRAMYFSTRSNVIVKCIFGLVSALAMLVIGLSELVVAMFTWKLEIRHPWDLINEPFKWPQMFIYSKSDKFVAHKDVEKFMEIRKSRGVPIHKKEFPSGHCMHLKEYPEDYKKTVFQFLDHCIPEQNNK